MTYDELMRLSDLRDSGALTDAEFTAERARLLGSRTPTVARAAPIESKVATSVPKVVTGDEDRQPGWEYVMLADAFLDGVRRHDAEYQRFNVAAAVLKEAAATCSAQMKATGEATDRDFAWFSQDAMEAAVGKEGQDGDPKAIAELAAQWVKLYEDMMAFAVQLSDRDAPPPVRLLYLTEALMMARPLREIREFAEQFDSEVHNAAAEARVAASQVPSLRGLTLTMDPEANKALGSVTDWLLASLGPAK